MIPKLNDEQIENLHFKNLYEYDSTTHRCVVSTVEGLREIFIWFLRFLCAIGFLGVVYLIAVAIGCLVLLMFQVSIFDPVTVWLFGSFVGSLTILVLWILLALCCWLFDDICYNCKKRLTEQSLRSTHVPLYGTSTLESTSTLTTVPLTGISIV